MRISRLYLLFIWTASLLSTILYMTSLCGDKQPKNDEIHITNTKNNVARTLEVEIKPKKQGNKAGRIQTGTVQYKKLSYAENGEKGWNSLVTSSRTLVKELTLCSTKNKHLKGRLNIPQQIKAEYFSNQYVISDLKYGGFYKPRDCIPTEKLAIIIPYRDRTEHLQTLVNFLHMMLQRQKLHYGIYVVEMALPVQFNRGLLANAGFMTAQSIGNYTCYIVHDVDLLPINDFNSYTCGKGPKHLVARSSKFEHGQLPYEGYVGGVLALSREQILKVNGFSNLYFGWGGEDDDMYKRIIAHNLTLERVPEHIGVYTALPHDEDTSNPSNPYREILVNQAEMRMNLDGLSSIKYHRKSLEFRQLYTWILIDCVESEVMENYAHLRINSQFIYNYDKKRKSKIKTIKINNN